jgi:hypothetical protein
MTTLSIGPSRAELLTVGQARKLVQGQLKFGDPWSIRAKNLLGAVHEYNELREEYRQSIAPVHLPDAITDRDDERSVNEALDALRERLDPWPYGGE